ncbi:MAG: 4-hydroxy-tetrahydrodipicolinate reductase [Polyangia bacterium]
MSGGPTGIALIGAAGRMGRAVARAAHDSPEVSITAAVDRPAADGFGRELGELAGVDPLGVKVGGELLEALRAADVAIDLSHPSALEGVLAAAVAAGRPLVCGTTGLDEGQRAALERAAGEIPLLYAANLSPGIAVMTALLRRAVAALGPGYDLEIVEMHHRRKLDAPSGTALQLAGAARQAAKERSATIVHGRSGPAGERPAAEIGVHALRGGGVVGEHTAILAGEHERIEISHRAGSRELFATGALRAALFLAGAGPGFYSMNDALGL